jgi:hypothetical protein
VLAAASAGVGEGEVRDVCADMRTSSAQSAVREARRRGSQRCGRTRR